MQKTFAEDLDFKIWATKGTKFIAHERLSIVYKLSNTSLSYLTAYLVIINLIPLFEITKHLLSTDFISFFTTVLSILVLVFGQIESSSEYNLKALQQHECGRLLSKLHLELSHINLSDETAPDKQEHYKQISMRYADILDSFPNHNIIDYDTFKARNQSKYKVSDTDKWKIRIRYYFSNIFLYQALIYSPLICILLYSFYRKLS
jgi:SMODS and SLOG-associating 2TM effector domain family 5